MVTITVIAMWSQYCNIQSPKRWLDRVSNIRLFVHLIVGKNICRVLKKYYQFSVHVLIIILFLTLYLLKTLCFNASVSRAFCAHFKDLFTYYPFSFCIGTVCGTLTDISCSSWMCSAMSWSQLFEQNQSKCFVHSFTNYSFICCLIGCTAYSERTSSLSKFLILFSIVTASTRNTSALIFINLETFYQK